MVSASSAGRLHIGQLLVRLLYRFRQETLVIAADRGYDDIRTPHVHIFANLRRKGIRLSELAARAQLSLATTSEFVSELENLGYLERRPDPSDGRAKLIVPTRRGLALFADARKQVLEIERDWAGLVGRARFDAACEVLQEMLDGLTYDELITPAKAR